MQRDSSADELTYSSVVLIKIYSKLPSASAWRHSPWCYRDKGIRKLTDTANFSDTITDRHFLPVIRNAWDWIRGGNVCPPAPARSVALRHLSTHCEARGALDTYKRGSRCNSYVSAGPRSLLLKHVPWLLLVAQNPHSERQKAYLPSFCTPTAAYSFYGQQSTCWGNHRNQQTENAKVRWGS